MGEWVKEPLTAVRGWWGGGFFVFDGRSGSRSRRWQHFDPVTDVPGWFGSVKFKVVHGLPAGERGVVAGDSGEQRIVCSRGFCSGSDLREFGTVGYEGWTFDGYPLSRKGFGLIGEPLHFFMPFVDRLH